MDGNLTILLIVGTLAIASMLAASLKQAWAKATTIILNILVLWFGFQWKSWLGAIGAFLIAFILTFILSRTVFRTAVAKANKWDEYGKNN